jgi:hypothetical protein
MRFAQGRYTVHMTSPRAASPGRGFIVSGPESALERFRIIGRVGGDVLEIEGQLKLAVSELHEARERGLAELT